VNDVDLIRLVDDLEEHSYPYLTLSQVEQAAGEPLDSAVAEGLLLVDYRQKWDGTEVTVCRLNRHHPLVQQLTSW
jgi:hypothetical protein